MERFRVNSQIGMVKDGRKMWIATAIGAGLGLASSLIGGHKAARAAQKAEERQRRREAEEGNWFRRVWNQHYVDTAAGQNTIRLAKEAAERYRNRAAGEKAVGGGTDAATQMAKDAGNKLVGDAIANIEANDTQRRDRFEAMHQQNRENFARMDMDRYQRNAQNIANAAQNASNALFSAGATLDAMGEKPDLTGGSNNSKPAGVGDVGSVRGEVLLPGHGILSQT